MKRIFGKTLAAFGALFLFITLTPAVKWSAEALSDKWGGDDADVLVVLGGSMLIAGEGSNATLGYDTYLRCVLAAALASRHQYRYIVVTGSGGLAPEMERFLLSRGVNPALIVQETAAQSTFENAAFTRRLLESRCRLLPSVVILTSEYHSRRARMTFQRAGLRTSSIPAPDVIKRSSSVSYRVEGAFTIAIELVKVASYKLKGYA